MATLDEYERKARLTPGLLGIAPITFVLAALGLKEYPAVAILGGVLATAGGAFVLSVVVGNLGRSAEVALFSKWGGAPTTRFLRLRETPLNAPQRAVWRSALESYTGIGLCSADAEMADPEHADNTIVTAVGQVRHLGHGGGVPSVKSENAQFGYERNLFAFRWFGRAIGLACIAVLVIVQLTGADVSKATIVSAVLVEAGFVALWTFLPSEARTQMAGARYATQLFNAVAAADRNK